MPTLWYFRYLHFKLNDLAAAALLLQVTMPVAVSSYMLAEKYSSEAQEVAARGGFDTICAYLHTAYVGISFILILREITGGVKYHSELTIFDLLIFASRLVI